MEDVIKNLDKKTRNYISAVVSNVEPEDVDDVVDSIQTDMFAGAHIIIELLIDKFSNEEMNHWEIKQEMEGIRHKLAIFLLNEGK